MKLVVLAVGRLRSEGAARLARDYAGRAGRYASLDLVEVRDSREKEAARAADDEGARLLAALRPDDRLVLLDERGKSISSPELAAFLGDAERAGGSRRLVFAVGGAWGVSDAARARAERMLSLSKMTLPHELARVVLLEQLYRAFTILRNEPYHHG